VIRKTKGKLGAARKRVKKNVSTGKGRCRFCADKELKGEIDYKNASLLKAFLTDCGKIVSSRVSGNCSSCQRKVSSAIKISRIMGLVPFCAHSFT